eukprot:CAMPEP_0117647500 /NCGR_PEP_ID=MMETSP0802-20121206/12639_1 /TAXON_ID=38833 /ORGANISM="Micromonas sp., Strain CCMP2099" /LENGTH=97 /DNA_ID=CAMNT_0005452995 /DNA_START=493 /DNA_END=787 /DNA_ORIENTATION=+
MNSNLRGRQVGLAQDDSGSGANCATVIMPMSTWCEATVRVPIDAADAVASEYELITQTLLVVNTAPLATNGAAVFVFGNRRRSVSRSAPLFLCVMCA